MDSNRRDLSIYVHIPFCKKKCSYCDFLSFSDGNETKQKLYVEALCKEIAAYHTISKAYRVKTIFLGGGTPSYIDASLIGQIMQTIRDTFDVSEHAEITIEGNPDSLTKKHLCQYREFGINRLSIGLQSASDDVLCRIGRVHNFEQFVHAFTQAREVGFENINIDIMASLPGDSLETYEDTLEKVLAFDPEHISAYSLIVEEGTELSNNDALCSMIPNEEEDRKMYARTKEILLKKAYARYEISNYAKQGYACKHNLVYWTGGEYLGVGLGAASYMTVETEANRMEKIRFHGVENLDEYIGRFSKCSGMQEDEYTDLYHYYEDAYEDVYEDAFAYDIAQEEVVCDNLSRYKMLEQNVLLEFIRDYYRDLHFCKRTEQMEEFMFLGLRRMKGVSRAEFQKRFGVSMESIYGRVLKKYIEQGLLMEDADSISLSEQGIDVSNVIMAEFML